MNLLPDEQIDTLLNGNKIIQNPQKFMFGIDAVLLSAFAAPHIYRDNMIKALSIFDKEFTKDTYFPGHKADIEDNSKYLKEEKEYLEKLNLGYDIDKLQAKINDAAFKETKKKTGLAKLIDFIKNLAVPEYFERISKYPTMSSTCFFKVSIFVLSGDKRDK